MNYLNKTGLQVVAFIFLLLGTFINTVKADQSIKLSSSEKVLELVTKEAKSQTNWFNYQVKMEANNGMPCCFQGANQQGCSLTERRNSWGTSHSGVQQDSKLLDIYFKSNNGVVNELFIAGSECPVERDGLSITSFEKVNQQQSVEFLTELLSQKSNVSRSARKVADQAVAAIALHRGKFAHEQLAALAFKERHPQTENAIFWLGQARNKAGYNSLVQLLDSSEFSQQTKKRAVFALSVNKYDGSKKKLVALAKAPTDELIRSEAIFWVAQNNLPQALEVIEQALESGNSRSIHDKAVFALSQLKSDKAWKKLTSIATQHPILEVQKQAVFWLSENKQHDSSALLIRIALGASPMRIREHAVFALSQLTHGNATKSLVKVLQSADNRKIKQKAIFWLGQSKDEEALEYIESIILASN